MANNHYGSSQRNTRNASAKNTEKRFGCAGLVALFAFGAITGTVLACKLGLCKEEVPVKEPIGTHQVEPGKPTEIVVTDTPATEATQQTEPTKQDEKPTITVKPQPEPETEPNIEVQEPSEPEIADPPKDAEPEITNPPKATEPPVEETKPTPPSKDPLAGIDIDHQSTPELGPNP